MITLTLIVFVFTIISSGYMQEISSSLFDQRLANDNPSNPGPPLWTLPALPHPLQNYQTQQRRKGKPCPRRSNRNLDEHWIPSYSSKMTQPLHEPTLLLPQALKNDEYKDISSLKTENDQNSTPDRGYSDTWTTPYQTLNANDVNDDCVEQLESTNGNAEETALKIIEDCLKKKKNKVGTGILGSSRRSMFGVVTTPAPSAEDDSNTEGDTWLFNIPNFLIAGNNKETDSNNKDTNSNNKETDSNRRKMTSQNTTEYINAKSAESKTGVADSSPPLGNSLQGLRICYACSTATNPSCWEPDKRTTIKYCTKEQSCVTKTFGVKNSLTLIRDCANSCKDSSIPGLEPQYKSCKLCHSDYCNSATSISGFNLTIISIIGIASALSKYSM